jgi:SAM-dependent methyltransferase
MDRVYNNVYDNEQRARAYAELGFPGTYYLAFRDLPSVFEKHAADRRALDFGCGTGRSTRFLRDLEFDVVGVDISAPMLDKAREFDPNGDYRLISECGLNSLEPGSFDLILSAFTFDNIPSLEQKKATFLALKRLLVDQGCIVNLVSSSDIYINEWASFSTRDYPENKEAGSGDKVFIVMLDVPDRRPVEDVMCTDNDYREIYEQAGLSVLETLRPLATGTEPIDWKSETKIAPWVIYVLGAGVR